MSTDTETSIHNSYQHKYDRTSNSPVMISEQLNCVEKYEYLEVVILQDERIYKEIKMTA